MKLLDDLKKINHSNILFSTAFMTMGLTSLLYSSTPVFSIGLLALATPVLGVELFIRHKLKEKNYNAVSKSIIPSTYIYSFSKSFNRYIENSESDLEKKYKIIFASFVFKMLKIEPAFLFKDAFSQSFLLAEKYELFNDLGKLDIVLDFNSSFLDYKKIIKSDLENKDKLNIIKKVFQEIEPFGFLGSAVSKCFGIDNKTFFISQVQDYKLTTYDIKHIKVETQHLLSLKDRQCNQAASGEEEQFIFSIIDNNMIYLKELTAFYQARHCNNDICSYPKLINYLTNLNNIIDTKENLELFLDKKPITKTVKKI